MLKSVIDLAFLVKSWKEMKSTGLLCLFSITTSSVYLPRVDNVFFPCDQFVEKHIQMTHVRVFRLPDVW